MMRRTTFLYMLALMVLTYTPLWAQSWATKMFDVTQHDFGTIARGAKAEFEFPLKNIYLEDVHIADVHPSCGCTSVRFKDDQRLLKTYQRGAIVASINSDRFLGQRGATITVTFDKPFYAQAQLQVSVYIRPDLVLEPGSVEFGSVEQGTAADKLLQVSYSGGGDLRILGVKSTDPHVVGEAVPIGRNGGWSSYQLRVRLQGDTPPGYIKDHLLLMTSDPQNPQIPVLAEGRVLPSLVVSPNWLLMGVVQPGEGVTKQLVVQAKRPFLIKRITPEGNGFSFDLSGEKTPKQLHVIPVTFRAGDKPAKITETLRIETDLGNATAELAAQAVVAGEAQVAQKPKAPTE